MSFAPDYSTVPKPCRFGAVRNLSVVIPTLNESAALEGAVNSLADQAHIADVVVVDGGSKDDTVDRARALGVRAVRNEPGRGLQIAGGIRIGKGDVVLILHADCRLRPGVVARVLKRLNDNPLSPGGSLGMLYDRPFLKNRLLSWLNDNRARWAGISFGDQGQFVRREALRRIGGFPEQMLMEDVELSLRLRRVGPLCHIPWGIVVSGRRWRRVGFGNNFFRVITLCLHYLVRRRRGDGARVGNALYRRYYGTGLRE